MIFYEVFVGVSGDGVLSDPVLLERWTLGDGVCGDGDDLSLGGGAGLCVWWVGVDGGCVRARPSADASAFARFCRAVSAFLCHLFSALFMYFVCSSATFSNDVCISSFIAPCS